ncbi:Transcription antitermination protein RfaH [Dyadobacter sp. CECT 9275]|uniref:Transcription antitermination protein RfaH n=1 Tax=Dyadobacter helix TaxID=2822344 RepID=A0A916N4B1_9BACT|nr:UpxY family transcription antiterminator [Dyadobacter sp. CECT 9275]CAG4999752.1 Transcription antitermination protein RfaH [Dyadobacter sp. CECT 9275]
MNEESLPWRVVQTRSRSEKKTAAYIQAMGVKLYLPLQKRKKQWSDRTKVVEEPLFPGYLFAQFEEGQRYPVLNTPGVVRIVSFGGEYASIPDAQIDALQNFSYLDNEVLVVNNELLSGQEVLIASGPFKNLSGRLVRHNGKGKLLIEFVALGQGLLVELDRTKLILR